MFESLVPNKTTDIERKRSRGIDVEIKVTAVVTYFIDPCQ